MIKPPPKLKPSEWSDEYRYLSPEASAEPGKFRTERAEYQRDIMDAFIVPGTETIVFMKSAQVGATETLNNLIAYAIDQDPASMMMVQPTDRMAETWSKDRFAPMIRDTPRVKALVSEARTRDSSNTLSHKTFPGGLAVVASAASPSSLASRPIRYLFLDEVDRYPMSAGSEGDPCDLAIARTKTYYNRKIVVTSTPTVKGLSRIENWWQLSDQRYYWVPCPVCGAMQILNWSGIDFSEVDRTDKYSIQKTIDKVFYKCPHCEAHLYEKEKHYMVSHGQWRKSVDENLPIAGFFINELYSPWSTWAKMVQDFLNKKDRPETLQTFINLSLGELYEDQSGESVDENFLKSRIETYFAEVPKDCYVLVAGVDTQDNRLECIVYGFGKNNEMWFIEKKVFAGDPRNVADMCYQNIDNYLMKSFQHESGIGLKIAAVMWDTAGHATSQVYRFVKPRQSRRIHGCIGRSGVGRPVLNNPTTSNREKIQLYTVGTDTVKNIIFSYLKNEEPGAAYIHLNEQCDEEYFRQMTSEKQVEKFIKGSRTITWQPKRKGIRNEDWDITVYAYAAFESLNADMDAVARTFETRIENEKKPAQEIRPAIKKNNWVNGWR